MSSSHGFIPASDETTLRHRVKAELRKRMRGLRAALPVAACADKSRAIVSHLEALEPIRAARAVGLFWPMHERREIDIEALDGALRSRGTRIAYPFADPEQGTLSFRFVAAGEADPVAHPLGFRQPRADAPEAHAGELDAIVVPALAVDPRGHRIGYGAGFYDRVLPTFAPPAIVVVVAYDFQLLAELPNSDWDVAAAWIVTDARAMKAE